MKASLRLTWDDHLILRVNGKVFDLGENQAFRTKTLDIPLKAGDNIITVKLSNTVNTNHGGWAFAFIAALPDGTLLLPQDCSEKKG